MCVCLCECVCVYVCVCVMGDYVPQVRRERLVMFPPRRSPRLMPGRSAQYCQHHLMTRTLLVKTQLLLYM